MDTDTTPRTWYVSDLPSVGDVVVHGTAYGKDADEQAGRAVWTVIRVNLSTGRGTVKHATSEQKAQVVRGRFGWKLANGRGGELVRFATETTPVAAASDGALVILPGDVNAGEPRFDEPTFEAVLLDAPAEPAPCIGCGGTWSCTPDCAPNPDEQPEPLSNPLADGPLLWVVPETAPDADVWHAVPAVPGDGTPALCGAPIEDDALVLDRVLVRKGGVPCPSCLAAGVAEASGKPAPHLSATPEPRVYQVPGFGRWVFGGCRQPAGYATEADARTELRAQLEGRYVGPLNPAGCSVEPKLHHATSRHLRALAARV